MTHGPSVWKCEMAALGHALGPALPALIMLLVIMAAIAAIKFWAAVPEETPAAAGSAGTLESHGSVGTWERMISCREKPDGGEPLGPGAGENRRETGSEEGTATPGQESRKERTQNAGGTHPGKMDTRPGTDRAGH